MKIIGKKDSYKRGQTIGFGGVNLSWVNKMQVFVLENVKILGGVYRIEWNSFRGEKKALKRRCVGIGAGMEVDTRGKKITRRWEKSEKDGLKYRVIPVIFGR